MVQGDRGRKQIWSRHCHHRWWPYDHGRGRGLPLADVMKSLTLRHMLAAPCWILTDGTRLRFSMLVLLLGFALGGHALAQGKGEPRGVFQALKPGQLVRLSPAGHGWDVTLMDDGKIGTHQLVEVGATHLQLRDISGLSQVWVPITAIHSVTWTQVSNPNIKPGQLPSFPPAFPVK